MDELTIARSRKHLKNFYEFDPDQKFPVRNKPYSVYPEIDLEDRFPSYDRLNKQILEYKLSVFNPSAYVKPAKQKKYEAMAESEVLAFKQTDREHFLIGMMKVNYLKRLESSIESFEISINRTLKKIEDLLLKIDNFKTQKSSKQEETLEDYIPDEEELEENSDDIEQWQVGKKLKFDLADLKLDRWAEDLKKDKDALVDLFNNAQAVTPERDAKLAKLKEIITDKIKIPININIKKVIVFTAFSDTAEYLYKNLVNWCRDTLKLHCALVCGSFTHTTFGKNDYDSILMNFSPVSKNRNELAPTKDGEIDILIASDCISEGQNLQDCDCLINYDIHWNPVRIIQRFGRIDRLGSTNDKIQLINFWPTKDLDSYINLKSRVEARMALVDVTATGEDNILNTEKIKDLIEDDLKYRNRQLKKLQNEFLDLEDMDETVSLTDFTLDDFRIELSDYIESNRKQLKDAPLGLYATVPAPGGNYRELSDRPEFTSTEMEIITPGVIFCLSQKTASIENEQVNPLHPYFLVYIRDDGTVRYNYTHAKHILEIYRLLCQGKKEPYIELCRIFNEETNNGRKMDKYTELLNKAVNEIIQIYKKKGTAKLTRDRGGLIAHVDEQLKESDDFELITWLVIR